MTEWYGKDIEECGRDIEECGRESTHYTAKMRWLF